jgi:mono/diheme cytochrome c family protein
MLVGCRGRVRDEAFDTSQARIPRDSTTLTGAIDSGIVTPAEIALGDSVFNGHGRTAGMCSPCHGQNGAGTGAAPSLADTVWINGDGSIGFIKGTMYQGVPRPREHPLPMPPLGASLTERQLQAVAAYVYALSHGSRSPK